MSAVEPTAFCSIIHHAYPNLAIHDVLLNQEGQYNDILIVNDELIFRFAKFPEGIASLQREAVILSRIQAHLTLAVPNPIFQHLGTGVVGESFIGYRLLPGIPLWQENFQTIHERSTLERIAQQLAAFLRELHAIPLTIFEAIDLPFADQPGEWINLYERIQQKLFPLMRSEAKERIKAHFNHYFAHPDLYHFEPVLRHGDFGGGNILYDPETQRISAIIDFGAATLGDPAIDFAGLLGFGEAFCRPCYAIYPELAGMRERVDFYRGTFALQEALYRVETGDVEAFAAGMQDYQ